MDSSGETTRLREEVRYLRRRLQYLQSVSTVFRQRISLLLREVAEDPSRVRELHAAYTALLSETALAEKQDSSDPYAGNSASRSGSGFFGSPTNNQNNNNTNNNNNGSNINNNDRSFSSPNRDPLKAREDVRRAHHLCMILQERNELKQRELELEQVNRELMSRLEDMEKNHNAPKGSYVSAANAMQQQTRQAINQNTNNITSFLENSKKQPPQQQQPQQQPDESSFYYDAEGVVTSNGGHKRSNSQDTSTSSAIPGANMLRALGGGDFSLPPQAAIVAMQRQNAFLKSRVQRLKQELDESLKQRQTSVTDLQSSLDGLAKQAQILKTENSRHQREVAEANRGKLDAQKELLFQKSREELLMAKLDSYYHNNNNNNNQNNNSSLSSSDYYNNNNQNSSNNQMVQVLSHQLQDRDRMLGQTENRMNDLEDQLRESEAKRASKDVEIAALGAQLKGLRARLDTFDAERSASQAQQSLVADVHDRLLSAVVDIQRGANSDSLARSIGDVSAKLDRLEGLEQQLRQKEDMLALADDEVARSHAMQQQLKEALAAFSPLFLQLPKSADSLERLVIERDELLAEIRKAASDHRPPDLNSVEGKVELRVLQTNSSRNGGGNGNNNNSLMSGVLSSRGGGSGGSVVVVPPLPPLLDIRAEAHDRSGNVNTGRRNNNENDDNYDNNNNNINRGGKSRIDAIPLTHLTPNDISATFRLFAPARVGSEHKLSGEQLGLCFAALGVPMPKNSSTLRGYGVGVENNNNNSDQQQKSSQNGDPRRRRDDQYRNEDNDQKSIALTEAELIAYIVQKQNQ